MLKTNTYKAIQAYAEVYRRNMQHTCNASSHDTQDTMDTTDVSWYKWIYRHNTAIKPPAQNTTQIYIVQEIHRKIHAEIKCYKPYKCFH